MDKKKYIMTAVGIIGAVGTAIGLKKLYNQVAKNEVLIREVDLLTEGKTKTSHKKEQAHESCCQDNGCTHEENLSECFEDEQMQVTEVFHGCGCTESCSSCGCSSSELTDDDLLDEILRGAEEPTENVVDIEDLEEFATNSEIINEIVKEIKNNL